MNFSGSENVIDDPVMVDGKFVRKVGRMRASPIYYYVYLKDSDKNLMRRAELAVKVGAAIGITFGTFHVASYGRTPKWASRMEPFIKLGFSCANGVAATLLHTGTVSLTSQLLGDRELVRSWALGGLVAGAWVVNTIDMSVAGRAAIRWRFPLVVAGLSALIKVATVLEPPVKDVPTTYYGTAGAARHMSLYQTDVMNPYRLQEEELLEKYL